MPISVHPGRDQSVDGHDPAALADLQHQRVRGDEGERRARQDALQATSGPTIVGVTDLVVCSQFPLRAVDMAQTSSPSKRGSMAILNVAAPRVSLGEVVAERLRQAILDDDLTPGQHLREEEISELLQVSRGPVRDAFILLEREGLVSVSRHRGASVVALSTADLGEVYSLRSAIEELAVKLAIRRHEAQDLSRLDQSMADLRRGLKRKLEEHEAARLDLEFHDAIFRAAHHERLFASWSAIRLQVYWFLRQRNIASADWRRLTIEGHEAIVDHIRAGSEDAAVAEIHAHIQGAYGRIIGQLTAQQDVFSEYETVDVARSFMPA